MSGPVGRWLETFMCKQYADLFEAYGFKTLQSVCQLQPSTLHSMGIPPEHCDKILENVSVLRQSLVGSVGSNYSDHGYDHQLAGHGQNNSSYPYHTPSSYPSHPAHQYGNPNGPMNHSLPYPTGEGYSGGQAGHYATSTPDVYGQSMYNNHLHPNHGSWEDPMRLYNHSPRHVMGSSPPPPPSSMMRSPPPPPAVASPPGMGMPTHYSRHVLGMEQPPPTSHHHSWPQTQVMSPAMVNSPRGTPSPGMAHPSSIGSPAMSNCSPAHGKPFSPPPYSPHPPPAHQQSIGYDYPPSQNPSPSLSASAGRHLASPSLSNSPSDPLQRLQKMVMIDQPGGAKGGRQLAADGNCQGAKAGSKFSSVEQLAGCGTPSPCPSYASQKSKSTDSLSPPTTTSADSTGKSSIVGASPASDAELSSEGHPARPVPLLLLPSGAFATATAVDGNVQHRLVDAALKRDGRRPNSIAEEPRSGDDFSDVSDSLNEYDAASQEIPVEQPNPEEKRHENGHSQSEDASLTAEDLSPAKPDLKVGPLKVTSDPPTDFSQSAANSISKACDTSNCLAAEKSGKKSKDAPLGRKPKRTPSGKKRHRKKRRRSDLESDGEPKGCGSGDTSKLNGQKLGNWNLEASSEMKFVVKKVGAERSVVKEDVPPASKCDKMCAARRRRPRAPAPVDGKESPSPETKPEVRTSPRCAARRSERLHSLDFEGGTCKVAVKCEGGAPPAFKVVNGIDVVDCVVKIVKDRSLPAVPAAESLCSDSASADGPHAADVMSASSSPEVSRLRRRGRPIGSKNKPRAAGPDREPKAVKRKRRSKERRADLPSGGKRPRQPVAAVADCAAPKRSAADCRHRGPYLHLDVAGSRLRNVTVVNAPPKDEESDAKGGRKRACRADEGAGLKRKMMAVGFHSTLSANYDVFTKDKTWVCALCHKGSHYKGLGDLFGPFFEEVSRPTSTTGDESDPKPSLERVDGSDARTGSGRRVRETRKRSELVEEFFKSTMAKKGKRAREVQKASTANGPSSSASSPPDPNIKSPSGRTSRSNSAATTSNGELWVHEDCLVWCHGVYLMGQKILGLKDAIQMAAGMICSKCSEAGAMIGCRRKGCPEQYHYICAIEKDCKLDEEQFSVFCAKHKRESAART